jgi:3-oxoacyl-[acyl-carrier protein] reductase
MERAAEHAKNTEMLLQNKNAIIYGAGGSLGGAVASALAKAGAKVFVTGHKLHPVEKPADEINAAGGKAEAAEVDALEETQVNEYLNKLVSKGETIDISFNAISLRDTQGIPLTEMSLNDFVRPINIAMKTQFITSTAAGRVMSKQGFGVILSLTATPGGIGYANVGGFGPACCAIEGFARDLASELGPYGVRVVNIRSGGSPDSRVFKEALAQGGEKAKEFIKKMEEDTMLKKLPMMEDIANTAVFLASDMAGKITGCTVDVTCGTTSALNYKVTPIAFVT